MITPVKASLAGDYISKYLINTRVHLETGPSRDDHTYVGEWFDRNPATMRWRVSEADV
jgi:hypothetical protein